jgi:hypothetical protein
MYSGDDLPGDQQDQARGAVGAAVSAYSPPTETVGVGQSYATGVGANGIPTSRRATQPLTASLTYSLFVPDTSTISGDTGMPCASGLCSNSAPWRQHVDATAWQVEVVIEQHWRLTTSSGATVGSLTLPQADYMTVALVYDPDSGWQLPAKPLSVFSGLPSEATGPDSCTVATHLVESLLLGGTGTGWQTEPGPANALPTCALNMQSQNGSIQAQYIWRFGVLSAADAQAHALAPSLPVAHPDEIAAVSRSATE